MAERTAVDNRQPPPSQCWCCGRVEDPARLVHLGARPEVGVCIRCAHALSRQAWELEDQARTGPAVRARDRFRRVRRTVIRRGWHQRTLIGPALRWIGRFTP
ncbi:MAG TPA: hypothetical protein VHC49_17190 [Mycobacteriales bacterium]|nr:hypothetical protein [Mycobacteriales bacterium]